MKASGVNSTCVHAPTIDGNADQLLGHRGGDRAMDSTQLLNLRASHLQAPRSTHRSRCSRVPDPIAPACLLPLPWQATQAGA